MKNCFVLLLLISMNTISTSNAQAVQKGNVEASLGLGFGFYGTGNNIDDEINSIAIPGLINVRAQYAVAKWVSAGLIYERNGFLTDPDSTENAKSNNFYLGFTFRLLNKETTIVTTSLDLGLESNYSYEDEASKQEVTSKGGALQIGFGIKHFISEHIGIGYDFALASYAYDKLEDSDGNVWQYNDAGFGEPINLVNVEVGFVGVNHRIGVTYKF